MYILNGMFIIAVIVFVYYLIQWLMSLKKNDNGKLNSMAIRLLIAALVINIINLTTKLI